MGQETLQIITALKAVIQKEVTQRFGHSRPTVRGIEEVRKFAQDRLDQYVAEMKKNSPELQKLWALGHPLIVHSHLSVETRHYAIEITTKDNPKAL